MLPYLTSPHLTLPEHALLNLWKPEQYYLEYLTVDPTSWSHRLWSSTCSLMGHKAIQTSHHTLSSSAGVLFDVKCSFEISGHHWSMSASCLNVLTAHTTSLPSVKRSERPRTIHWPTFKEGWGLLNRILWTHQQTQGRGSAWFTETDRETDGEKVSQSHGQEECIAVVCACCHHH